MLTADAIKLIQDTARETCGVDYLNETKKPTLITSQHAKLIDLEHLMENRARYRAEINTSSVEDFAEYTLSRKDAANRRGFINTHAAILNCQVIFNIGTPEAPGHCDDTATLSLEPTAAYAAMRAIDGKSQSQKDLVEWIEDWAENITPFTGVPHQREEMDIKDAIAAIRSIKINANAESTSEVGNLKEARSALEQIEARATGDKVMPEYFLFECRPYDDLELRDFYFSLSVLTSQPPQLKLRWMKKGVDEEAIEQEFKTLLKEQISTEIKLTVGTFKKAA
jgi:uncharacterized protein YfdQ (DUF2303 family)